MTKASVHLNIVSASGASATQRLRSPGLQRVLNRVPRGNSRRFLAACRRAVVANAALICAVSAFGLVLSPATAQVSPETLRSWGMETYNETDESLRVSGTQLFAETASLDGTQSGGFNGRAFVWPVSTLFRVFDTLAQIQPATYAPTLRTFSDQVHAAYWDNGYRSGAGGGDRFYDDNAHLVVALVEAFRLTGDSIYLDRARVTQQFVLQGEDTVAGGGIYFKQFDFSSKDAISTLQGARGAAMLYRATGEQPYLLDAIRLLVWSRTHIQESDGLFSQRWDIAANGPDGVALVNSAGIGISLNLELYDATGTTGYLAEAQRIAARSLNRYFDAATGRINDEGYWAFELVDALGSLYLHDGNVMWLQKINVALAWLHDNKRDPNGHYDVFWGREGPQIDALSSWHLNEQASAARAYLYTSVVALPPAPPLWLQVTSGDAQVELVWRASVGANVYSLHRSTQPGGPYASLAPNLSGTSYADATVANGVPYFYVVTAGNVSGFSAYSEEVSATPCIHVAPDLDSDCDVDGDDLAAFLICFTGPDVSPAIGCENRDFDDDNDVDLADFSQIQRCFHGQGLPACAN